MFVYGLNKNDNVTLACRDMEIYNYNYNNELIPFEKLNRDEYFYIKFSVGGKEEIFEIGLDPFELEQEAQNTYIDNDGIRWIDLSNQLQSLYILKKESEMTEEDWEKGGDNEWNYVIDENKWYSREELNQDEDY